VDGACSGWRYLPLVGLPPEGGCGGGAQRELAEAAPAGVALEASGSHAQRAGGRLAVREGGEGRRHGKAMEAAATSGRLART
jgi:hypothetical protein